MGARGRGSLLTKEDRERERKVKRDLPWKRKGLSRVQRVISFLEDLPITKGIMRGRNMELLPEQREFVTAIYGPRRVDGRRKVSVAIRSEPKGNGKTGLAAGLALCHLLGPESEERGEVYSAAVDREQAGIIFREMEAIIRKRPGFAARVNVQRFNKRIEVLEGDGEGSFYEALSSDARKAQGLAPSFWIYDEMAQAKDRELQDNLMEGMGKRSEALGVVIFTQAPSDDHPLSELIDYALTGEDESMIVKLTFVPPDANIFDDRVLKRANPAWGKFLDLEDLMRSKERARRMPGFEPSFRNLRCNQRVDASGDERVVSGPVWKLGEMPVDRARLRGRKCYGGLDLSGKLDLTALVLVFPDDDREPSYDILPLFWTPKDQLEARQDRERDLFKRWIKEGHLIVTPGKVIRTAFIASELAKLKQEFDIKAIGYDRWRIDDLKADMAEADPPIDLPLEPYGQGFKDMSPAIDFLAELALSGRLRHGGHPVLTSHMANAIVVKDAADNKKLDKARSHKAHKRASSRIDGASALAMACGVAKRFVPTTQKLGDVGDFLKNAVMA